MKRNYPSRYRVFEILGFCLALVMFQQLHAQPGYKVVQEVVGHDYLNGQAIEAPVHKFNTPVYDFDYLEQGQYFLAHMLTPRSMGEAAFLNHVIYNTSQNKILWQHAGGGQSYVALLGDQLFKIYRSKIQSVKIDTGKKKWYHLGEFQMALPDENRLLLYAHYGGGEGDHLLKAYELNTGRYLWKRTVPRLMPWQGIEPVGEGKYLLNAGGLHLIDMENGDGWFEPGLGGYPGSDGSAGVIAAGIMFGIVGALVVTAFQSPVNNNDPMRISEGPEENGISKLSDRYLIADLGGLLLINPDIKEKRPAYHYNNRRGARKYMCKGNTIYMLQVDESRPSNEGRTHRVTTVYECVPPSPEKKLLITVITVNDNLLDFTVRDDRIYLLFEKSVQAFSTETGVLLNSCEFKTEEKFRFRSIYANEAFWKNNKTEPMRYSAIHGALVLRKQDPDMPVFFDQELNRLEDHPTDGLTHVSMYLGTSLIFQNGPQVHFCNSEGVVLKSLDRCARLSFGNGLLRCSDGKDAYQLPLEQFMAAD